MAEFTFDWNYVFSEGSTGYDSDSGEWELKDTDYAFPSDTQEIRLTIADEDVEEDHTLQEAGDDGKVTVTSIIVVDASGTETELLGDGETDSIKFDPSGDSADSGSTFLNVDNAKLYFLAPEMVEGEDFFYDPDSNTVFIEDKNQFGPEWGKPSICFVAGTLIDTPDGPRPVDALAPGDLVLTADGRETPVTWVGQQVQYKPFCPWEKFAPVCVPAGALGGGLPKRDLKMTSAHGVSLGGFLVQAKALIGLGGVYRVPNAGLPDRIVYYQIETERHEWIIAEGVASETVRATPKRKLWANYKGYLARYGALRQFPQMDAPRVKTAAELPDCIRERFEQSAAA